MRLAPRIPAELAANPLSRAAAARRARGEPLLDATDTNPTRLGLGLPEAELRALLDVPGVGEYAPTPAGLPSAREAVAAYYAAHGVTVRPEDVVLTASTSEAYGYLFRLLAAAGDEVLAVAPSYPLFAQLAALHDLRLRQVPLQRAEGWFLDLAALEAAYGSRTRAVLLLHPNNPTGSYLLPEQVQWLRAWCAARALPLIVDEVFLDYSFGATPTTLAAEAEIPTFVLSGLSKVLALPQLKLGWIVLAGPPDERETAREGLHYIADAFLSVNTPVQLAASALLARREAVQGQIRARLRANLQTVQRALAGVCGVLAPEGGWYVLLRLPPHEPEETWVWRFLAAGVFLHPGWLYDFPADGYAVLSLLLAPEELAAACRQLAAVMGA